MGSATQTQLQKSGYQFDALLAMDKSSMTDGFTPFHEAVKHGNLKILEYLFRVLQKRNEFISNNKTLLLKHQKYANQLQQIKSTTDLIEFTTMQPQNMTLLLLAAQLS